jgi:protein associated with RNAse G/E
MKVFREFLIRDHAHFAYNMQKILKYRRLYLDVESYVDMVEEYLDLEEFEDDVRIGKYKN